MSDNTIEIIETSSYTITIDTNLVQNDNGVTVENSSPNSVGIIDNNIILVSDIPPGYSLDFTTGSLPISRVSGLDILGGSGISVSDNSGIYTIAVTGTFGLTGEEVDDRVGNLLTAGSYISLNYDDNLDSLNITVTGLQPSGIYASGIHTHASSDITDFHSSVSGLLPVKDIISGSGILVSHNNGIFGVAVTGTFGLTGEQVDDRVNDLLKAGSYVNINYNDSLDTLTINVTGLQPSGNYSVDGHPHVISDVSGLQNALDNKQPSGIYASGVHYHTSSDITNFNSSVDSRIILANLQPSGNYALDNHIHGNLSNSGTIGSTSGLLVVTTSDGLLTTSYGVSSNLIKDFQTSVSGLLPTIAGSGYIVSDFINNQYILSTSGLQPSGNYSDSNHTHGNISNNGSIGSTAGLLVVTTSGGLLTTSYGVSSNLITNFQSSVSGLLPKITGISGVIVANSGNDYLIGLSDPSVQLINISDLSSDARAFLLTPSSSNLQNLITNETGSGLLVFNNSPSFSGIPTVPTAPSGTNNSQIANTSFVRSEISNLVNSAPSTLDTLNELATALGSDPNFATTIASGLAGKASLVHSHASSDITNFNSSVSGLLPSVTGSGHITSSFNNNVYTIGVTGLQPSGNYANAVHTHSYSDITDFASGIDNEVSTLLVAGSYVNLNYDNVGDTLTISVTGVQPSGNYANSVHSHGNISSSGTIGSSSGLLITTTTNGALTTSSGISSSYITNFSSSVSGLLPSVTGTGYVNSSFNNNIYTISVTGLQPSGNYSTIGHTHTASSITDFNTSVSGLLPVTNILAGSNIGVSSSGSVFTVSVTGQLGLTTEEVDDRISNLLIAGSYVNLNYDDNNNNLTVSVTGVQPSGNYANSVHTHISSDITDFNSSVSGLIPVKDIVAGANIGVSSVSGVYTISTDNESSALVTTVFNKTGSPISKMSAVYIDGGQGDQPTVALAVATGDPTSAGTYGVTFEAIPNMSTGKVIVFGALTGVDTDIFNPTAPQGNVNGQVLYLSPTTPGGLTLTKPSAPNHIVTIGTIVRTHQNEGVIEVRVQNGFELDELHNVAISGVTSGQFLQYNGSGLWVPSSSGNFSTLLVNGTGVSLNGHTHTSSNITDFNSSVSGLLPITNIVGGTNISVTPSGTAYTISVSGSLGLTTEEVDDRVSNLLVAGTGISLNYNDGSNTLTINTSGLQPSGNYSLTGHTHSSSDISDFNASVSGLLPVTNITAGSGISVSSSSGNFTINAVQNIINGSNLYLWANFR